MLLRIDLIKGNHYLNNFMIAFASILLLVLVFLSIISASLGVIYFLMALIVDITSVYMFFYGLINIRKYVQRWQLLQTKEYVIGEQKQEVN